MTRTEKLLRELISLPSVNPAFLPANDPRAGEKCVADFLAAVAARAGLDVELQKVFPDRSNLLARFSPGGKAKHRIVLAPHLDTVNAAHENQFVPHTKNGQIFGRGACDTKGSVAAMFAAICEIVNSERRPRETEIIFAGLIDEENAQAGSRALVADKFTGSVRSSAFRRPDVAVDHPNRLKAELQTVDLAIVGEPTCLQVITAHKGNLWLQLETHGKAAHGATPQFGRNAVLEMARIVDALETGYAAQLRKRRHPLLGCGTINVGTIHGGTQANIVPDSCTITVDRRTLPGETEAEVRREISAFLAKHKLKAKLASTKSAPCVPLETDSRLPLVQQFFQSVGQKRPLGVHFFCDAAVLSGGGIPSIVFGPGDVAQAHTADEWISLRSLERGKEILVNHLKSLP